MALGGVVLTLPVQAAAAVAVRATSRGPALHRAIRVGRDGRPFVLLKFRSMRTGAAGVGPGITVRGDARVTPVGTFLRRTKLDELPQLYNVLRGQMSLVGPRPEDPGYVAKYTPEQRAILAWRPGITSPASVTYRDEEAILADAADADAAYAEIMAMKLAIDLDYLAGATLLGDVRCLIRTVGAVFSRREPNAPR